MVAPAAPRHLHRRAPLTTRQRPASDTAVASRPADLPKGRSNVINWAIFFLFALVVAAPYINYKPAPFTGEGNPLRQLAYIVVFVVVLAAARVVEYPRRLLAVPMSLAMILGFCWLSLGWSISPDIAIRRLVLTTVIAWTVCVAVRHEGFDRTVAAIRNVMVPVLIANYLIVVLWPSEGIHHAQELGGDPGLIGNWRGFLLQKNFAGAFCAFTIIFYIFDARSMGRFLRFAVLLGAAFFLYKTSSKTSMGLLVLSMSLGWAFSRYNPRYRVPVCLGLVLLIATMLILANMYWASVIAPFSGEDALTGRVQIWPVLIDYWHEHWLGAGYGSFWNIGADSPIFQYSKGWVADLGNGHNGYLDLLTQIGMPGLVLTIVTMIVWPLCRLLVSTTVARRKGALVVATLIFCAGHNMTETSILDRDAIVQVFLMFALALMDVAARPTIRPQPRAAPAAMSRALRVESHA